MIHDALFSSAREDWETPQALYAALERCFGFRLDAAASAANAKAPAFFDSARDALAQDWAAFGRVWLNPPYGRSIGRWMHKAAAEAARGCPARFQAKWKPVRRSGQARN
jgi:phage N-6-adenine-methyltransferase